MRNYLKKERGMQNTIKGMRKSTNILKSIPKKEDHDEGKK
jgi:hypothetical protein